MQFFPTIDPGNLYINLDPPEGADLEYVDSIVKKIEIAITDPDFSPDDPDSTALDRYTQAYQPKTHKKAGGESFTGPSHMANIEHIFGRSVKLTGGFKFDDKIAYNHIGVEFIDREDRLTPSPVTVEKIRNSVKLIPGARITVAEEKGGPPTGAPINIEISGDNFQTLGSIAKNVMEIVATVPFIEDLRDDYVEGLPSILVKIDRQKAAMFGLSTGTIGFALKTAYNGIDVSSFYEDDEDYDITVRFAENNRKVTDVLNKLMIPTSSGQLVPLTTISSIDYSGSIGDIVRINHERTVTVKANVDEDKVPGAVAKIQVEKLLKKMPLPPGYRYKFTGQDEVQKESADFLKKAFLIAVFFIFLILT